MIFFQGLSQIIPSNGKRKALHLDMHKLKEIMSSIDLESCQYFSLSSKPWLLDKMVDKKPVRTQLSEIIW